MTKSLAEFDVDEAMASLTSPIFDDDARQNHADSSRIELYRLNDCCVNQVNLIMEYASNYELASAEEAALKDAVTRAYAILDPQARNMLESSGTKPTEGKIEATIKNHPEYVQLQTKYHAAVKNAGQWKAARDAVMHRKDMLVQLAANYRAENTGEVSIRDNMEAARNVLKHKKQ